MNAVEATGTPGRLGQLHRSGFRRDDLADRRVFVLLGDAPLAALQAGAPVLAASGLWVHSTVR